MYKRDLYISWFLSEKIHEVFIFFFFWRAGTICTSLVYYETFFIFPVPLIYTQIGQVDKMDLSGPNKWKWTDWTELNQMDRIEQKWTE